MLQANIQNFFIFLKAFFKNLQTAWKHFKITWEVVPLLLIFVSNGPLFVGEQATCFVPLCSNIVCS